MAAPTAAQIEADVTLITYRVELLLASVWTDVSADVIAAAWEYATSGDPVGIAFGATVGTTATVDIFPALYSLTWQQTPIRISVSYSGSDWVERFRGVIMSRSRGQHRGQWQCRGYDALIEGVKLRTELLYNRLIATPTTASSVEDSTSGSYSAGWVNRIFWGCGGRPFEQAGSYPTALFYYSVPYASPFGPEWYWLDGENMWNELQVLCKACGGQVYQGVDGVVRYVEPLSLAAGGATYTYTDAALTAAQRASNNASSYGDINDRESILTVLSAVVCPYTSRKLQGAQRVYQDGKPKRIKPSTTISLDLDTQVPILTSDIQTLRSTLQLTVKAAVARTGRTCSAAECVVVVTGKAAQRVSITVQNTLTDPIDLNLIEITARPLTAEEPETARYSSGAVLPYPRELDVIGENPAIQTRRHAEMLCRMLWDFHGTSRPVISLSRCALDSRRYVGELINLTSAALSYSNLLCRIIAIRPDSTGFMDVEVASAVGLPIRSQQLIIGASYGGTESLRISY
jgi:hypothetical protein